MGNATDLRLIRMTDNISTLFAQSSSAIFDLQLYFPDPTVIGKNFPWSFQLIERLAINETPHFRRDF
jgi:hypothetical protein